MATVLARRARILAKLLTRHRCPPEVLFAAVGLDMLKLSNPRARVLMERYLAAWEEADRQIDAACWPLEAGEIFEWEDLGALGQSVLASRTLRIALQRLCRYQSLVVADFECVLSEEPDRVTLSCSIPEAEGAAVAALEESWMAVVVGMARRAYGRPLPLMSTTLREPRADWDYASWFGCPVTASASGASSVVFDARVADRFLPPDNVDVVRATDTVLRDRLNRWAGPDLGKRLRRVIATELPSGRPSVQELAQAVGIGHRTLQRRLRSDRMTADRLTEEVRADLAQGYLRSGKFDVLEVAYLLGFSTMPAFSRAYKRCPPGKREARGG